MRCYAKNAETSCSKKFRDFIPKHHAQNIHIMLKIQKWSYILCSKREVFIHIAIQNFTIIHRAQDNSWTTHNFQPIVLYICTSVRYPVKFDLKFTVQHDVLTSVMAYHEHCILVQQKLNTLFAFTDSVLHASISSI